MLCRIRQYISQSLALQLYSTLILPDFDYTDVIYDAISQHNASRIQVMQNQCLKICTNSKCRTNTTELHTRVNLPLLSTRKKVHTCNFVHRGLNKQSSKGINDMFNYHKPRVTNTTRVITNKELVVPRNKLQLCNGNIKTRGAVYYNSIDYDVKTAPSYNSFKSRLKKHLY